MHGRCQFLSQGACQTCPHFSGSLIGKGDRQNIPRADRGNCQYLPQAFHVFWFFSVNVGLQPDGIFFRQVAVWEYIWVGHRWKGYVLTRAEGALLGMLTITALFYTYTGICGRHWLWADILTFVLGAAVTAFWTWKHTPHAKGGSWLGILLFAGVAVCFGIFSLFPPTVGIFGNH